MFYNSDDVVEDFFASLARQTDTRFRLYVIDNSPTDSALDAAKALAQLHGMQATFVFNDANLGVAKGNNQGIALALKDGCTHVLLANNDVDFYEGTIGRLLSALTAEDRAATPKILYHGEDNLIWFAGGAIKPWTMLVPHFGMLTKDHGQFDKERHTPYAPTCFMLFAASVFAKVGVMDETYFVYYDDADFVWRMRECGLSIRYVPESVVWHKVSTSTGGFFSPFTIYYTNRNRIYFIRKNLKGLQRAFALSYVVATRILYTARLPRSLSSKLWTGLRDGWRMPLNRDRSVRSS